MTASDSAVFNPPGQASISYRAGDFAQFRQALLSPLPGEQAVGAWRPAAGDLGLQMLEWWAYLGDILTFYNERYANESFLRTATRPQSVTDLVALLGYRPEPGLAATGVVAATRKPGFAAEPLVLPTGMPITSTASAGVPSQVFEVDAPSSYSGPTQIPVTLPPDTSFGPNPDGSFSVLLAGRVGGVKAGDTLVLMATAFDGSSDDWAFVSVTAVAAAGDPTGGAGNTRVTFTVPSWGWGPSLAALSQIADSDVTQTILGRLAYLDPASDLAAVTDYRLLRPTATAALWTQGDGVTPVEAYSRLFFERGGRASFPVTLGLSGIVRGLTAGDLVLVQAAGTAFGLGVVTGATDSLGIVANPTASSATATAADETAPPPSLIVPYTSLSASMGAASVIALELAVDPDIDAVDPGSLSIGYALKDVGQIVGTPPVALPALPATVLTPALTAPSIGATALLTDTNGAGIPVTVTSVTDNGGTAQLELGGAGDPPASLQSALAVPLTLLLDVVTVSRGQSITGEVLGSGNAALVDQSFTLAKSPLTYLPGASAPISTLVVWVNGVMWQEVSSFYGQAPGAQVYVVSRSADDSVTTISFGDGVSGARLPSGSGNVTADYRYGSGAVSPPAGRLTTITKPQPNLAAILNPVAVSPGTDPPPALSVRTAAAASVSCLGRAISATDYVQIALQAPGVARAAAAWTFDPAAQRPRVQVYVGDGADAAAAAAQAIAGTEDPNRPVRVVAASAVPIGLSCTLVIAGDRMTADVLAAAQAAISDPLTGLFSPTSQGIGAPVYRSAVMATLRVPGVVAVRELLVDGSADDVLTGTPGAFYTLAPDALEITAVSDD